MVRHAREVSRVLWTALVANAFVAIGKTVYGLMTGTLSMVADGLHSFSDAGGSILGLISIRLAKKPSDQDHHYGYAKFETLAALGIGAFIALTGWEVMKGAIGRFVSGRHPSFHPAGVVIMLVTMAVNIGVAAYERRKGKQYESTLLIADSFHTGSDVYVSLSVLTSLLCLRLGYYWADHTISLVISLYLGYVAYRVVKENVLVLSDAAFLDPQEIRRVAKQVPGVLSCHRIRTRGRLGYAFIDLHIQLDPETPTNEAHSIVHQVEERLRSSLTGIQDVLIHAEPFPDEETLH